MRKLAEQILEQVFKPKIEPPPYYSQIPFEPLVKPQSFTVPMMSTAEMTYVTKDGKVYVMSKMEAEAHERAEEWEKSIPKPLKPVVEGVWQGITSPPAALLKAVVGTERAYVPQKTELGEIYVPREVEIPTEQRILYGTYGAVGTASLVFPLAYPKAAVGMAVGGALTPTIGAGLRYVFEREKAFEPSEIASDIAVGMHMGSLGSMLPVYSPLTHGAVRFLGGGLFGAYTTLHKDIALDIAKGEQPKIDYPPLTYAVSGLVGGVTAYGIPKLGELVEKGKIGLIKPGFVRSGEGETWAGLYYQKGPEVKWHVGIMKRPREIEIGRGLEFTKFVPGKTPWVSPIEFRLSFNALKEYYDDLASRGLLKGSLTTKELEGLVNIIRKMYQEISDEPVRMSLYDIVKSAERLKDVDREAFYNFLVNKAKKGDLMFYGSATLRMLMGKEFGREIHDFDIQMVKGTAKGFVDEFLEKFGKDKFVVREIERGYQIYNKAGEKIMEVFDPGYGYSLFEEYIGYGFGKLPPMKTKEGFIMRLEESGARKLAAGFAPTPEGIRPAEEHYIKHAQDVINVIIFKGKTDPHLKPLVEEFLKTQKSDLLKKILENLDKANVRFVIEGVSHKPSSVTASVSSALSVPAFSSWVSSQAKEFYSKPSDYASVYQPLFSASSPPSSVPSLPSSSVSSESKPSESKESKPSESSESSVSVSSPSYSYSISSPSYSYSYSYYSYSLSKPEEKKTLPSIPVPTFRLIELRPTEEQMKVGTRIVSELKYI